MQPQHPQAKSRAFVFLKLVYLIYSNERPGRFFNFFTFRVDANSRVGAYNVSKFVFHNKKKERKNTAITLYYRGIFKLFFGGRRGGGLC